MSLLEITWTDPVTGRRGYVVIDSLVRGVASGGLRLREGCTLDEVRGLARGMSLKEALVYRPGDRYVPLGGAKGGIDVDPLDPQAHAVLKRFFTAVLPVVRAQWNTGEDFGLRQDTLDEIAGSLGLASTVEAAFALLDEPGQARERLRAAMAVTVDGVPLPDLVGGYGVARAALEVAGARGIRVETAVVQGFGSIGGAAARYLARAGVAVVGVADRDGLMRNPAGLDVERMLAARDLHGTVDRRALRPDDQTGAREEWLDVPADLLVPAAMSYVIGPEQATRVLARLVVEGANLPTLPEAESVLLGRGVPVVPDFLANVMTNAWWWWVLFGDIEPTAEAAFAKIDVVMRDLVASVTRYDLPLRKAALGLAESNAARVAERFSG
ncbi:Glu/Leu/Phe/Val dehydrogenase dimerization domain-containing protein [Nonomuraea endophytica]|uniref:Glutamate dehydrogenase n=1 Tax=Nonomuraea endophytica TaxID=714136 RepID=A0A7W8ABQ0_9ACTN|nr:Glu/Leu/Phe/Val dehydrogenase dimerization domain-containing protein [Nonomuraea endophytica]MBB5081828.1 glutamate dehydrogenase (NAD(P)+) [Nonomuraea endophytica]